MAKHEWFDGNGHLLGGWQELCRGRVLRRPPDAGAGGDCAAECPLREVARRADRIRRAISRNLRHPVGHFAAVCVRHACLRDPVLWAAGCQSVAFALSMGVSAHTMPCRVGGLRRGGGAKSKQPHPKSLSANGEGLKETY